MLVEGGFGHYNSFNETFSGDVSAKGDINYFGVGLFAKHDFDVTARGNAYVDGSIRIGHANRDYASENVVQGSSTSYSAGSGYMSAHATAGYKWNVTKETKLDAYVKYLWARQSGDTVQAAGSTIDFDALNSHRLRAGFRFTQDINECVKRYAGLAYEYEFDAKAGGTVDGYAMESPELKGGSVMGELGVKFKPSKTSPWDFNFALQGFTGKRESIGAVLGAKYEF